jgi:hypothetical protein
MRNPNETTGTENHVMLPLFVKSNPSHNPILGAASLPTPRITIFWVTDSQHPAGFLRYIVTDHKGNGCNPHDQSTSKYNVSFDSTIFKAVCKQDKDLDAQLYCNQVLITAPMPDGSTGQWLSDCSVAFGENQGEDPNNDIRWIPVTNIPCPK